MQRRLASPIGHASAEVGSRPEPDDDPAYQQPRCGPAFPPIDPCRGDRRRNYRKDEADQLRLMPRDPKTGAQSRGDREAAPDSEKEKPARKPTSSSAGQGRGPVKFRGVASGCEPEGRKISMASNAAR